MDDSEVHHDDASFAAGSLSFTIPDMIRVS
jgi:hypothetical protein